MADVETKAAPAPGGIETMEVLWPDQFGQKVVTINANDFDPKIHKKPGESHKAATHKSGKE